MVIAEACAPAVDGCALVPVKKTYAQVQKEQSSRGARGGKARLE